MNLDSFKRQLQSHFSDGLVLVIGSGLSCAEGLPGMGALATAIINEVPHRIRSEDRSDWDELHPLIVRDGLEPALFTVEVSDELQLLIADITARVVAEAEAKVLAEVLQGRKLRLSCLIPHLLKTQPALPVITTNYDRLVEAAFEECGLGVDNMFVGDFAGQLNEKEAAFAQLREVRVVSKMVRRVYRNHVKLSKPHGSLDWYDRDGRPVRCAAPVAGLQRLIIAPGRRKFRTGYESPFDLQRERANRAIDSAARFLVIGYGFNDDHLETHLTPCIRAGKPTVLLTRELTPTAEALTKTCSSLIALERRDIDSRTRAVISGVSHTLDVNLWDLGSFVEEVFAS